MNPSTDKTIIQAEQVRQLFSGFPVTLVSSSLLAVILAYTVWGAVDAFWVIAWFALVVSVSLARAALMLAYRRAVPTRSPAPWLTRFRLGSFAAAAAWGLSGVVLFPANDVTRQAFLAFVLTGFAAGGTIAYSVDMVCAIPFVLAALLPFTLRLLGEGGDFSTAMGMAVALFLGFVVASMRRIYRSTTDNIVMRMTATKRANDLYESETKLRTLYDSTSDAVMLLDGHDFLDCNKATLALFGCATKVQFCAKHLTDLSPPEQPCGTDSLTLARQQIARAMEKGSHQFEWTHKRIDTGVIFPTDVLLNTLELDGKPVFQATVRDISARKQADMDLRVAAQAFEIQEGMVITDENTVIIRVNQAFSRLTGYTADEVVGKKPSMLKSGRQDAEFYRLMWESLLKDKSWHGEIWNRRKNGEVYPEWLAITAVLADDGKTTGYVAAFSDITERKKAEAVFKRHKLVIDTAKDGFWMTDATGNLLEVNSAYAKMSGYTMDELVGMHISQLEANERTREEVEAHITKIIAQGYDQFETRHLHKDGHVIDIEVSATFVPESQQFFVFCRDITVRKQADQKIHQLAFYDVLTNLPNRRLLMDRLQQAFAVSARNDQHGAVLFLDLDNFKTLNDTKGHEIGDLLLIEISRRLGCCVRDGDTVARLGGDEFVIVLEDLNEEMVQAAIQAELVADKIIEAINQPYDLKGYEYHTTSSIGISVFQGYTITVDELLKRADTAMYQAKQSGRNALRFFDPAMQVALEARMAIESDLRGALTQQQYQLYYQAQVDRAGCILGAEVLLRWNHPVRGLVSPMQFIPLAEETGFILPIGLWVLETACRQIKAWESDSRTHKLQLAVNISARQFRHPDFVMQVREVLEQTAINPSHLKLELTESMVLDDVADTIAKMQAIKQSGVRFSMDDFGTGYSSLSYLTRLPLDQLKIDQSFVRNIGNKTSDAAIVKTIIGMASNLEMEVIAEGVETGEQHEFLEAAGCVLYQGYLFSKPVPLEEFAVLLAGRPEAACN